MLMLSVLRVEMVGVENSFGLRVIIHSVPFYIRQPCELSQWPCNSYSTGVILVLL